MWRGDVARKVLPVGLTMSRLTISDRRSLANIAREIAPPAIRVLRLVLRPEPASPEKARVKASVTGARRRPGRSGKPPARRRRPTGGRASGGRAAAGSGGEAVA